MENILRPTQNLEVATGANEGARKIKRRLKLTRNGGLSLGAFAYIAGVSISSASASAASLAIFPTLRWLFLALSVFLLAKYVFSGPIKKSVLASLFLLLLTYTYGLMLTVQEPVTENIINDLAQSFVVVSVGILFWGVSFSESQNKNFFPLFACFAIGIAVFQVVTGGIILAFPPEFVFEIFAESGSQRSYSQGVSAVFGVSAIVSLWFLLEINVPLARRLVAFCLFIVFFVLSFLGGGRGEFVFLLLTFAVLAYSRGTVGVYLLLTIFLLLAGLQSFLLSLFSDTVAISRFLEVFRGDTLGLREILFGEAVDLLLENSRCLFFGCGFNFFQAYYGYSIELYPHNILLEAIISFGIIFTFLLTSLIFLGVRHGLSGPLYFVGMYWVLIGMKSGSVIVSWLAVSILLHLAGLGLVRIIGSAYRRKGVS